MTVVALANEANTRLDGLEPEPIMADLLLRNTVSGADVIRKIRQLKRHMVPVILVAGDTATCIGEIEFEEYEMSTKQVGCNSLSNVIKKLLRKLWET